MSQSTLHIAGRIPPMKTHLTRIDREQGIARFYAAMIWPSLFGDFTVVREWGRIGHGGTVRGCAYASEAEARHVAAEIIKAKARRGFVVATDDEPVGTSVG